MLQNFYESELDKVEGDDVSDEIWTPRKKIMVIDDDANFRSAITEILEENGYIVMTAKDGETGLNNLIHENELPDLILVDLMMPVKSGLEFRREQINLPELKDIPVVFVSGYGIVDGELCIQKPFEANEFIGQLKQYL